MASLTLEDMMPEIGAVFAVQEASLLSCMAAMTTSIARAEDEARQKVSAAEIQALRTKVRDAMDYVNEAKKTMTRLERAQEALAAEIDLLKRDGVEKDRQIEALQGAMADAATGHNEQLDELDKKFEYISKVKMEQKDVLKRLEKQEQVANDMRYGLSMLSKSINDEGAGEHGAPAPMSMDSKLEVIASVMRQPSRLSAVADVITNTPDTPAQEQALVAANR
ncbi:hypothetical protein ACHHYP_04932 [Achlya hypogyna]|uniref:Uncharacterized protein n=1 Tax=Achlya hypogyna TaxID=1202772 RepID=A0A1V9YZJ8_ACHHY|nr:hypothetical protein ACHHYP_04932 [Achlya hypogyna]